MSEHWDSWRRGAAEHPERRAYTFLDERGAEEATLTYGELDLRARCLGERLLREVEPGDRALLVFPPGLDFIVAFFACLYARVVAVPLNPPQRGSLDTPRAIAANCGARIALTVTSLHQQLKPRLAEVPELERLAWLAVDGVAGEATSWQPLEVSHETLAFLQYTSGSTSTPRGVMISHGNLLGNQRMIQAAFEHTPESTFVGWAPLHHDQGLIGNVLQPLYVRSQCVLMAPLTFVKRPLSWLKAISDYRARTSGGPNFAFELCITSARPDKLEGLDLSCWTLAFNGAEPIRADTLRRFSETFAPCGFRPEAMYPCYGLAEGTLFVTGGSKRALPLSTSVSKGQLQRGRVVEVPPGAPDAQTLVGCGRPWLDGRVVIVRPETRLPCAPLEEGEIWVSGSHVARGYWGDPERTAELLEARLAGSEEGPFLRTGDLGFLDGSGELFVTGRIKDLIILSGRNHYPHDLERTAAASDPALASGRGAAFTVGDANEKLVLVQEVERTPRPEMEAEELVGTIRKAVAAEHDVTVHTVVLVPFGSIPKTTSGKVQRRLTRQRFLQGELALWSPATGQRGGDRMSEAKPLAPEAEAHVKRFVLGMPWAKLLGLDITRLESGASEIVLPYREELSQGGGMFQAGVTGALADVAGGAAAGTLLAQGWGLMTVDYTVKLLAPAAGDRLIARGKVTRAGHVLTVSSVDVFSSKDGRERLCAIALVTTIALEPPKKP